MSGSNKKGKMENKLDIKQLVADAIAKFREDHTAKSFSQRHPELGKMLNCKICSRRHRSSIICKQVFTTIINRGPDEREVPERHAAQTRKGINGSQMFAKKRIKPHHSHARLLLVQMTQDLFPKYFSWNIFKTPQEAMHAARGEAQAILSRKSRAFRRVIVQQQHRSRQINAELIAGGTR